MDSAKPGRHPGDRPGDARRQRPGAAPRDEAEEPLRQVLFITGHSTLEALTDALELGATDYLLKPLDQTELIALIEDAERRLGDGGKPWPLR